MGLTASASQPTTRRARSGCQVSGQGQANPSQREVSPRRAVIASEQLGEERTAVQQPEEHERRGQQNGRGGADEPGQFPCDLLPNLSVFIG